MELLNSVGLSIVAFIFVLGVLIFIHELGHHLVAKYFGIRVEVFSLGFGKRLLGFQWGETDYRLSLIPLGGFVKMSGENPDEELTGSPDEFLSRPKYQRFLVALAGPVMNLGLALLLVAANFMVGSQIFAYLNEPAQIGGLLPDSVAEKADIRPGDTIVSVDGTPQPTWKDVEFRIRTSPDIGVTLGIEREGEFLEKDVVIAAEPQTGTGFIGVRPVLPHLIVEVQDESQADEAGLQPNDQIVAVVSGHEEYWGYFQLIDIIRASEGNPMLFTVRRGGTEFQQEVTARETDGVLLIGAVLTHETILERYGPIEALGQSWDENLKIAGLTFATVGRLIKGQASMKQMSGPIDIAKYSGMAASMGWSVLLGFMALVSLQLGLLNLLPIPVLDGGVITILLIEGLIGRDLSLKARLWITQVGVIFIFALMGLVLYNDITKNLGNF